MKLDLLLNFLPFSSPDSSCIQVTGLGCAPCSLGDHCVQGPPSATILVPLPTAATAPHGGLCLNHPKPAIQLHGERCTQTHQGIGQLWFSHPASQAVLLRPQTSENLWRHLVKVQHTHTHLVAIMYSCCLQTLRSWIGSLCWLLLSHFRYQVSYHSSRDEDQLP